MPRELIDTGTDKRYVRRDEKGQFKESDDVGRSSATDQKRDSQTRRSAAKAIAATADQVAQRGAFQIMSCVIVPPTGFPFGSIAGVKRARRRIMLHVAASSTAEPLE